MEMIPSNSFRRAGLFGCLSGLSVTGCIGEVDPPDSHESHLDEVPAWSLVEELRIGSVDDPDAGFSQIRGIRVLSDSRFLVAEGTDRELRLYDPDGVLLSVIGRRGQGPGEFEALSAFGVLGDTLWVQDSRNMRVTLFSIEGELLTTVPGDRLEFREDSRWARITPRELLRDGTLLGAPIQWVFDDSMRVPVVRFTLSGEPIDTVGWHWLRLPEHDDGLGRRLSTETGGVVSYLRERVLPSGLVRFGAQGGVIVAEQVGVDAVRVTWLDALGDTASRQTYRYRRVPVPDSISVTAIDQLVQSAVQRGAAPGAAGSAIRAQVQVPEFLFPITEVLPTEDGGVWLRREDSGQSDVRWTIIEAGGRPRGEVTSSRSVTPHVVRGSSLWGVDRDDLGVPYVVRYRIVTSSTP